MNRHQAVLGEGRVRLGSPLACSKEGVVSILPADQLIVDVCSVSIFQRAKCVHEVISPKDPETTPFDPGDGFFLWKFKLVRKALKPGILFYILSLTN